MSKFFKLYFSKIFIVSLLLCVSDVFAVLEIEVTQGVDNAMPIVILPFVGQETRKSADNQIVTVVSNDLKNSGKFRLIETTAQSENGDAINFEA